MGKGIIERLICIGFLTVLLQTTFIVASYCSTIKVVTGRSGELYYLEADNNRIVKIDSSGKLLASYGGKGILLSPQGIVLGGSESIFIADTGNKRVLQLKDEGSSFKLIRTLPRPIDNWLPTILRFNGSGELYITDVLNRKVWVFRPDGSYILLPWKSGPVMRESIRG